MCVFQGLGGVFHTSGNSRRSGEDVAGGNACENPLLEKGFGETALENRIRDRGRQRVEPRRGEGSGRTPPQKRAWETVPEPVPETGARKTSLGTCPKRGIQERAREHPWKRSPGNAPGVRPQNNAPENVSENVHGKVPGR